MARLRIALAAVAVCAGCSLVVDSAGLTGGGFTGDAGADVSADVGADASAADAAPMGTLHPTISCGASQCDPSTSFCCIDPTAHCTAPALCRPTGELASCADPCGYPQGCDDTADCADAGADLICCAAVYSPNSPKYLACLTLLDCKKQGLHRVACDPTAPVPCPAAATCDFEDGGLSVPTCTGL